MVSVRQREVEDELNINKAKQNKHTKTKQNRKEGSQQVWLYRACDTE